MNEGKNNLTRASRVLTTQQEAGQRTQGKKRTVKYLEEASSGPKGTNTFSVLTHIYEGKTG